ncbi:MAG: A/G-specific adenine glycosylase [Deltaproteobacteria bacterium]|nr:A/G-specific adenine glycosylase [Deltaproteobacteria bacterium]
MTNKQLQHFQKALTGWYATNKRELPWRNTTDPYGIWVSEVMLQQTQVNTVLPFYEVFLRRFPDIHALAGATQQEVLKSWEGLGYYARARNLFKAAGKVVRQYKGMVPEDWEDFRKLPGVGDYIAAAVLSMAFEKSYPVVDGNVKRVLSRLLLMEDPVNQPASDKHFRLAALKILDCRKPGTFNQAMMELGAMVCRPRQALCTRCPVHDLCLAYQGGRVTEFPKRVKKGPIPLHAVAVGVVFKNGRVLITRRKSEGLLGGLWEFPGGKIREGEMPETACVRELKEEANLTIKVDSPLCSIRHAYTHFRIVMDVFCCSHVSGRVRLNGPVDHRWISLRRLEDYPFPRANHKFMPRLQEYARHKAR